ncbi:hypothetical protein JA1_002649 [Spathaspora sp. JA1]|nr:hypothetical protein JA1_002649 [Spathaspora sp. JA1]
MRLSTVLLSSVLMTAINAAPALHTVYVTAFTTVLVDINGNPLPTSTEAPAPVTTQQPTTTSEAPAPTTTSQAPAPTTTSQAPAPAPTTSTTSSQAPAQTSQASSGPTGETFSGQGTYYNPDMGACGIVNSDSDYIVAISHSMFDAAMIDGNPNHNPICGKRIRAYYGGKSVDVSIVDRCVGCAPDDLDLSPVAFDQIADPALGRIELTWQWL